MQPIIPLRPQTEEGNGKAFILPDSNRYSALELLTQEHQKKKADEKENDKALQDQLLQIEALSADAVPLHQQELLSNFNNNVYKYYEDQKKAGKTFKPGSDEDFEIKRRLNKEKADAIKAKMYKDRLLQITKEYDPAKHEQESYQSAQQTIMNTPLQELDYNNIPSLQAQLNPVDYRKKVLSGIRNQEEWNMGSPVNLGQGNRMVVGRRYQDPAAATESVMNDNTYYGKKYRTQYYNQFLGLPETEQEKIIKELERGNVSVSKDPKLLKQAVTKYMVDKSFEGELLNEQKTKVLNDYEYQAAVRGNKPENAVNTTVSVSKEGEVDPLFGDRQSVTMDISTPPKGENEQTTFRSESGFLVDEGNNKIPVSLKGKPLKGSVIQVRSAIDPTNPNQREVYAVVEAKVLSNRELKPKYYRELAEKEEAGTITEDEKRILKNADEIPSKLYNVPLRDVAKNYQAELKRYNRTNIIGEIEKAHGIKYTDYITEENKTSQTKNKIPLPAGKPRRGKKNGIWYVWDENTGGYVAE